MKTSATKLVVLVSMSAVALAAGVASACPKGGYGGYSSYSSYSPVYVKKVYVEPVYTCYRPLHCFVFVVPGDTWATISQREYGSPNFFGSIASFNGISLSQQLGVGQQIRLPEIHPNGVLTPSNAPPSAPFALAGPGAPQAIGFAGAPSMGVTNLGAANLGTPNMLQNVQPGVLPNGLPSGVQGSALPQGMMGSPNGAPMNGMPTSGGSVNSLPTGGFPMNGGSPVAPNGSPIESQNFANAPIANGSAPIGQPQFGSLPSGPSAPTMNASFLLRNTSAPSMNASAPMLNTSAPVASTTSVPSANIRLASAEPSIPSVAIGSELVLDGPALGEATGFVRLRLSSVALKVEVLEWTAGSVRIRLPELELTAATKADLEVLRADGSLASKSAIQLTPAAKLAQGN